MARLQGTVGLQTDNHIVDFRRVDVAGAECVDASRCVGVDVVDALLALYCQIVVIEVLPQVLGLLGGVSQEGLIALIRRVVLLNKSRTSMSLCQLPSVKPSQALA